MRFTLFFIVMAVSSCCAQYARDTHAIEVNGDAEVRVVPDEVTVFFGVEDRNKDISAAVAQNNTSVKQVISAIRNVGVEPGDIQTDYFHVDIVYVPNQGSVVDYYVVTKQVQVVLKKVAKFEELLNAGLRAGANHLDGIEFRTTELRKYRDEARALAAKAAVEKAKGLADATGLKVGRPLSLSSYSYGGGSSYVYWNGYNYPYGYRGGGLSQAQNVVQNVAGKNDGSSQGTISLGKISVTASVSMTFQIQQ
jgi:uncharacterized protein YggE